MPKECCVTEICLGTTTFQYLPLWIIVSRKYAYVNDLVIMHAEQGWQAVEGVLSKAIVNIGEYLQTWKLKLSTAKSVLQFPSHSAHTHLIGLVINNTLCTVTGCMIPTLADDLPVLDTSYLLSFIAKKPDCLLACRAMEPGHLLHSALTCPQCKNVPICTTTQQLISSSEANNWGVALWVDQWWKCGVVGQHYKTPYFHPQHCHPSS